MRAEATVVKGGNRLIRVSVPIVSRAPDGQPRYESVAIADIIIPAGEELPEFSIDVKISCEEINGCQSQTSSKSS